MIVRSTATGAQASRLQRGIGEASNSKRGRLRSSHSLKTKPPAQIAPAVFSASCFLPTAYCLLLTSYPRGGNTPCIAMIKSTVRVGIMLLWGRLLPAIDSI